MVKLTPERFFFTPECSGQNDISENLLAMNIKDVIKNYNLPEDSAISATDFNINAHIHTPYSFSAFESINQATDLALQENVKVLGINDFNSADGYTEFNEKCGAKKIYPMFNIEFIGLDEDFQKNDIRVNDPNNPGRIYFSGKGLKKSFELTPENSKLLKQVNDESLTQVKDMITKANAYFKDNGIDLNLDFNEIKSKYAINLVRERHIAKAIRIEADNKCNSKSEKINFITKIYGGVKPGIDVDNNNALENEIRGKLLKSGGHAFVPENPEAFLAVDQIKNIIVNAGGVPCYPVLLDDAKGNFTDFEGDWDKMHEFFTEKGIGCIELIPVRNSIEKLTEFVKFFTEKNYVVLFGTEHNTPDLIPLKVTCRNNVQLSEALLHVNFKSTCIIAAHQFLVKNNEEGFIDQNGRAKTENINKYAEFGRAVLAGYFNIN